MKHFLFIIMMLLVVPSAYAADVAVSVSVGQPGFYGHIDIGNYPQPEVIYAKPIMIHAAPAGVVYQPMYVHIPPGHEKHWSKHCAKYNACGRPVYFVRDRWYNDVYVPQYQARHGKGHDDKHNGKKGGKKEGKKDKDNQGHGKGHD